jgi:uncharacterized delta-60 repeat protein
MIAELAPDPARADGTLDGSFSRDGRVVTDLDNGSDDEVRVARVDGNGRLLLAGSSFKSPEGNRLAIARYLPDGTLDPSFDGDGILLDNHGGGITAQGLALDSIGRIIVAGPNSRSEPQAVRFLDDGRIDPTFGRGGVAHLPFELDIRSLALDRRGRILLAGGIRVNIDQINFSAARLLDDGSLDPSFDGDGLVMYNLGEGGPDFAADVFIDGFDRIVLAGGAWLPNPDLQRRVGRFAIARLQDDGQLDGSFRGDGAALIAMNRRGSFATAAALDGVANAIVVGRAAPHSGFAKVRGAGGLGRGFGNAGRAKLATEGNQWAMDIELDAAGRPLAAIGAPKLSVRSAGRLIVARLQANGRPDRSFSGDSRAIAGFGRRRATASSLALYATGEIVVAGTAKRGDTNHADFVAARFR